MKRPEVGSIWKSKLGYGQRVEITYVCRTDIEYRCLDDDDKTYGAMSSSGFLKCFDPVYTVEGFEV